MDLELINYIKRKPVVSKSDIKKIINCKDDYAYVVLKRLEKKGILKQIIKGKYTTFDDIYMIASNIEFPGVISLLTASQLKNYTEQIINNIQILTTKNKEFVYENYRFSLIKSNYLFGYEKHQKGGYLIVDDNKLLIDMLIYQKHVGNFAEILKVVKNAKFNKSKICNYLDKIGNKSLVKRVGFLLEYFCNIDIFDKFKLDTNYIYLDILTKQYNKINRKWGVKYVFN